MKRNLSSNGNSWHIYLNKPLVQLLGITDEEYTVLITIENKILYAKKISNSEFDKYKNLLWKKLVKKKAGFCLNLPAPILEMLEINPEKDMIDYEVSGQTLIVKKAD